MWEKSQVLLEKILTSGKECDIIILKKSVNRGMKMKRIILLMILVILCVLFCSCEGIGHDLPAVTTEPQSGLVKLTPEEEKEIIDTFIHNANRDETRDYSVRCFWKSENAYAALIDGEDVIATETQEIINGYRFDYTELKVINVYCLGRVYALTSALDNGIITDDDLRIIYENYADTIKQD